MINKVKGTYDVLPSESYKWHFIERKFQEVMSLYHFKEIRTPNMEHFEVFHRDSEMSDMVQKETYDFLDRSNRKLTLRPEVTAGIVRAYIENKLYVAEPLTKVYYFGPNYRYERPQTGRYREFYQCGVEAIGIKSAVLDAEIIKVAYDFINHLNLKQVSVNINTLGDLESRNNYRAALIAYLTPFYDDLSSDSKRRLKENPLRILDSKDKGDLEIIKNAPLIINHLSTDSKKYFDEVLKHLDNANVKYQVNEKLVRGLDYYSHTVFEIEANIKGFGAQNVLGGGGRYDALVKELGGPAHEGIGFAFGVERLLYALEMEELLPKDDNDLDVFVIHFDKKTLEKAFTVAQTLRKYNITSSLNYEIKSFKSQLKESLRKNASYLIFIGEEELKNNLVTLKDTKTEQQVIITLEEAINLIKKGLLK